jgi:large subunit ribosomal protein L10
MNKEQKGVIIDQLAQKLNEYKVIYITDVSSLNAQKTSELRREFFKGGIEMEVAKKYFNRKSFSAH